jgi:acetyl-CoA carboxylase biotin carboxyl carrier protein
MEWDSPASRDVIEIIDSFAASDFDELRLEMEGLTLILAKGAHGTYCRRSENPPSTSARSASRQELLTAGFLPAQKTPKGEAPKKDISASISETPHLEEQGLLQVKAPSVGVFYRSPKPGAPPFVEVGTYVTQDSTVCLIEVMKLFNAVKAGVCGRVARVCAENAQLFSLSRRVPLRKMPPL